MKYRRSRQAAWRTIADETVVLDLERKRMYGLNPAAACIWQALGRDEGPGDLLRAIAGEGEPPFGEREITTFLNELVSLELVEEQPLPIEGGDERAGSIEASSNFGPLDELEPPGILWREDVEQIAGTCAFLPAQNPLCTQAPFS